MKKLTPALKRQITKDWKGLYPGLGIYEPMHLLRRVGPMLEGIALERDSGNRSYRPTFHVHNLIREFPAVTLSLAQMLRTERTRAPETIDVQHHESKFREAAERLQRQSPLSLSGDLALDYVLAAYRTYPERCGRPELDRYQYEDMALYCAWMDRQAQAMSIIEERRSKVEKMGTTINPMIGDVDEWATDLKHLCENRSRLEKVVQEQIKAFKVQDLPTCELKI